MEFDVVIGLEIHAELKTKTKVFCIDFRVCGKERRRKLLGFRRVARCYEANYNNLFF